jgi:hypothetical protein
MRQLAIAVGLIGVVALPYLAKAQAVDDPFSDYLQRSQSISLGAGNANDTNEALQTITPWPPHAFNTRIPVEGRQAVDSIQRMYRVPNPFEQQGVGAGASSSEASGVSTQSGTSPTGAAVTPMQPISSGN